MFKNYIKNIVNQINHSLHCYFVVCWIIKVITKLPNSVQSYKGKVKTHNYINRQNQSIPTFVGKHGSHKNGTGVFPTSILRSKKNQMLLMFYPKNKVIT